MEPRVRGGFSYPFFYTCLIDLKFATVILLDHIYRLDLISLQNGQEKPPLTRGSTSCQDFQPWQFQNATPIFDAREHPTSTKTT